MMRKVMVLMMACCLLFAGCANWSYVKKKYKLNVPNFHVPAGQVSLQEPQQILPLLSDILLRTD